MNLISPGKKKTKKFAPQEILENIKKHLKDVFKKKKEIEKNFANKFKELQKQSEENQKWFDKEWQRLEKLENQLILWWDFWKRELEINRLREQTGIGTLPSEREKTEEQIQNLNTYNKTIERGFKEGKVDAELINKLRKELEEWMEKEK